MDNNKYTYFHHLITWMSKPFPLIESIKIKLAFVFFFGVFIGLFILVFKPFKFSNLLLPEIYFHALGFGINSSVSMTIASFVLPIMFPSFFSWFKWNIGRQLCFIAIFFFIFTCNNWIYFNVFKLKELTGYTPLFIVGISFSIGLIPSILFILLVERHYLRKLQDSDFNLLADLISLTSCTSSNRSLGVNRERPLEISIYGFGGFRLVQHAEMLLLWFSGFSKKRKSSPLIHRWNKIWNSWPNKG